LKEINSPAVTARVCVVSEQPVAMPPSVVLMTPVVQVIVDAVAAVPPEVPKTTVIVAVLDGVPASEVTAETLMWLRVQAEGMIVAVPVARLEAAEPTEAGEPMAPWSP
jgi:hypothetical protein